MKKITLLTTLVLVIMFGITSIMSAQNLALNPGFESWTVNGAAGPADDWGLSSSSMTGAQESTNVRTGTYSTNITWTTSSTVQLEQTVAVTAGSNYSFSFWALDNDAGGRARVTVRWYDSGSGFISGYYGDYTSDNASWQQVSSGSQTAPAGAVEAHIEIRVYDVSGWPGTATIYVDDCEFVAITTLEITKAYAVSETAVDVLYSAAVTAASPGDYSLTGSTAITFTGATIDATNTSLVHLTGASSNMASDITLDNIADAANTDDFDFYAGIMSNAFVNTTNPGGTMANGELATFKGIVSANDGYNNVWYSDAAGAYNGVLIYSSSFDALVAVGDEILFNAKRTVYNGLSELEYPELISINSSGNTPYGPDVIPGSDIDQSIASDTDPAEKWEGQFVKIENFTVDSYADYDYTCSWSDGTNTYYFKVGDNVDYHLSNITLNIGETYTSISGVVDWYNSGPYYRLNPRDQADVVANVPYIAGSMNGWNGADPAYAMVMNANGLFELTKSLDAGTHEYKLVDDGNWYPGNNQQFVFTATENVTWKANTASLVTHELPVVAGDFLSAIGGTNWDPTDLMGEMTDPDGDDIFTLELTIPAGNYEAKVTLNYNWDQSTGGNVPFTTDGVTPTTFTYDFPNNTTTISGPPPPTATITFIADDATNGNYDGFFLKGSWDVNGQYDPSWGGGIEHTPFYDDGTHGDVTANDNIWTCQQDLVVDGGSNTWEWGINDTESNWVDGNFIFTIPDQNPQTLTWLIPALEGLVINEIMYNSPGTDEEWIELYNSTGSAIDLEDFRICDNDASHTNIVIPSGYSIAAGDYFTISIATGGAFPFTPDYDGTGAGLALNNGGDAVRIWNPGNLLVDIVSYDDSDPWPTTPDGGGPSLSLIEPNLDNALGVNWDASRDDGGSPGEENFPPLPYTTLTEPNGGEVITQGEEFLITWDYDLWTGSIDIFLLKDGVDPQLIVSNISIEDNSFNWTVMQNQAVGSDYKVQIVPADPLNPTDESDNYFDIIEYYEIPSLVITEIMYNPPESGNDSLEFIEIFNNGVETVNMDGFSFTAGVEFTFPNVEIMPEEYLLVGINSAAMLGTFGVDALQWTDGALSNGGEKIELSDSYLNVIDSLTYDDYLPWDSLADGYGPSLTLCNPDADNSQAENWTHSVNFAALNSAGDSIWATPGFGCQVDLLPGFMADITTVSLGESVVFTDQTVGDPIEWIWTFEGGTPATFTGQTPPAITYDEVGTWDVTLYVSDGLNNGEVTYPDYIEVVDFPPPTNLVAVVGPSDDVQLTWNAPGSSTAELIYDNDVSTGAYSYEGNTMATHMSPDGPCKVLTMKFYTTIEAGDNTFDANIFGWDGTEPSTELIYTEVVTGVEEAWLEVDVADQNINFDGDFLVGFGSFNATTFVGYDTDLNNGRSWDFDGAAWASWTEAYLIRAVVEYPSGKIAEIGAVNSIPISGFKSMVKSSHSNNYSGLSIIKPIDNLNNATRDLLGYNVYRDDLMINTATVATTDFNDPEPTIGSHDYYVTAVYDGGESVPSNVVSVIVTDINENSVSGISIYPNPTNGKFVIEFDNEITADVILMDITGKVVYNETVSESVEVNVTGLQKGIYLVRILDKSSNDLSIKKLIIR